MKMSYFSCSSDDSDESDGEMGAAALSLDTSAQHTPLAVKGEPCDPGEGLAEGKPLNGVLLAGKGKTRLDSSSCDMLMHMTKHVQACC